MFGTSKLLRHFNGIQDTNIQIPKFEQTMLTLKWLRLEKLTFKYNNGFLPVFPEYLGVVNGLGVGRSNILQTSSNDSPPAEDIVTNNWSLSSRSELKNCSLSSRLLIKGPSLLNRTGLMDLRVSLKVSWLSLTLLKAWSLLVPKIPNKISY